MWPDNMDTDQVDFQASPNENAGRIVTAEQINELYSMTEVERGHVLDNHLSPEQKTEVQKSINTITRFKGRMEVIKARLAPAPPPTYDKAKRQLFFKDETIQIPANTDQEELCKALFRNSRPIKRPLDIGDVLIRLGVPTDKLKGNKKVSYAKREINTRVAKQTSIDDLLVITGKQIWFNKKNL